MNTNLTRFCLIALGCGIFLSSVGCTTELTTLISRDVKILDSFSADSKTPIPPSSMKAAHAVAILEIDRHALILGSETGKGIIVSRSDGEWSPPLAIKLIGGTAGIQIGIQWTNLVIIFISKSELDRFMNSGTYMLANAEGTAIKSTGAADSKGPFKDVLVFTDTSGMYGGAYLGGIGIGVDWDSNRKAYGKNVTIEQILGGSVERPPGDRTLTQALNNAMDPR